MGSAQPHPRYDVSAHRANVTVEFSATVYQGNSSSMDILGLERPGRAVISSIVPISGSTTSYDLELELHGRRGVMVLPDTDSAINAIDLRGLREVCCSRDELAALERQASDIGSIPMANDKPMVPLGMVKLSFRLPGSRSGTGEWFYLFQKLACQATAVVGRDFCHKYAVFEDHVDALVPRDSQQTCMTIDPHVEPLWVLPVLINESRFDLVPDTGSDVNAMSVELATKTFRLRLRETSAGARPIVVYADGSEEKIYHTVRARVAIVDDSPQRGLSRSPREDEGEEDFGTKEVTFYIVQTLPRGIVLQQSRLLGSKIFTKNRHLLQGAESDSVSSINGIFDKFLGLRSPPTCK
jgi:hypothetical protein